MEDVNPHKFLELYKRILNVTDEQLKDKSYYKQFRFSPHQTYAMNEKDRAKVKHVKLASQLLNYFLIDKLKLTSHKAAKLSFRRHPTPLHATKVIKNELIYKSHRTKKIKDYIELITKEVDKFKNV